MLLEYEWNGVIFLLLFFNRFTFASASPDNIKMWQFPDGNFMQNLQGHNAIINCLAVNSDNVLVSGGMSLLQNLVWDTYVSHHWDGLTSYTREIS